MDRKTEKPDAGIRPFRRIPWILAGLVPGVVAGILIGAVNRGGARTLGLPSYARDVRVAATCERDALVTGYAADVAVRWQSAWPVASSGTDENAFNAAVGLSWAASKWAFSGEASLERRDLGFSFPTSNTPSGRAARRWVLGEADRKGTRRNVPTDLLLSGIGGTAVVENTYQVRQATWHLGLHSWSAAPSVSRFVVAFFDLDGSMVERPITVRCGHPG